MQKSHKKYCSFKQYFFFLIAMGLNDIGLKGARYYVRNLIGKYVKGCDA